MKIFDCFMYFNEDVLLDLRLNVLDKYVDYFVIVESNFTHKGDKRELKFDNKKFEKFKNKIIYLVYDNRPKDIDEVLNEDHEDIKSRKYILNSILRENGQRNFILNGLKDANEEDLVLISDVDEIPNLEKVEINKINQKIIMFKQEMFYYKFNLKLPKFFWTGTRACKKKYLKSPQWLRNIKVKKYSLFRLDALFSDTKFMDIKIIENGGWHFTYLKNADEIQHKLKSYLHHREFDLNPISVEEINNIIKNKTAIYDLTLDKRAKKIGHGKKLEKYPLDRLPKFLQDNLNNYQEWID